VLADELSALMVGKERDALVFTDLRGGVLRNSNWRARVFTGLDAHIQYFVDHPLEAVTVNRGALSDDPAIQAIITEELNMVGRRLIEGLGLHGHDHEFAVLAVHGWLVFVRAVCVEWVQSQKISRAELTQMCLRAFTGALQPAVDVAAVIG
jgi:hypothetical protein